MAAAAILQEKQKLLDLIQQRPQALGVAGSRWAGLGFWGLAARGSGQQRLALRGISADKTRPKVLVCSFIFLFLPLWHLNKTGSREGPLFGLAGFESGVPWMAWGM